MRVFNQWEALDNSFCPIAMRIGMCVTSWRTSCPRVRGDMKRGSQARPFSAGKRRRAALAAVAAVSAAFGKFNARPAA
jgi:hypothetical protein